MDFPVTREIITQLNTPVNVMAALLPAPIRESLPDGNFRWLYPLQSAEVVQVAKAVRMISSLRAALRLADENFTSECCALLRIISDFAAEILFIGEGILKGEFNASQQKFISQFFDPFPNDPDELAARERIHYVGRREIIAGHKRLAESAGLTSKELENLVEYLNKGYDSYIHGAYVTAMELFNGEVFMLNGHESPLTRYNTKKAIAGKLHQAITALQLMAITRKLDNLIAELDAARLKLERSNEQ